MEQLKRAVFLWDRKARPCLRRRLLKKQTNNNSNVVGAKNRRISQKKSVGKLCEGGAEMGVHFVLKLLECFLPER